MGTLQALVDGIRAATDHDTDTQVTDTQLVRWVNQEIAKFRRQFSDAVPHYYMAQATFTISSIAANLVDVTASPVSLTDFGKACLLEYQDGNLWLPLPLAPHLFAGAVGFRSWRQRGASSVEVLPADLSLGTYRLTYEQTPALLTTTSMGSQTVPLPSLDCERVVEEVVSSRIRCRTEEDFRSHDSWAERERAAVISSFARQQVLTPQKIIDVTGRWP